MNATVTGFVGLHEVTHTERLEQYIRMSEFDRPTLVVDSNAIVGQYHALKSGLGRAKIHYAVKANPEKEIVQKLVAEGCGFDAASRPEIELCLSQGASPEDISFGNTIKRPRDIAFAHQVGITLFAADAEEELIKLAENAPGARIYIRIVVENCEADWPLSRKFGCAPEKVLALLGMARELGLVPYGLSFHVGSQTRETSMWTGVLDQVADVWRDAQSAGFDLQLLNIGGGFPADYGQGAVPHSAYAAEVMRMVEERFDTVPQIMAEPGRGLVAEAGMISAEVILVSKKSDSDTYRWVYLDIGKFSGLAETMDESIRYQFVTDRDHEPTGPCVLAGPSCDSADVLYEKRPVQMPVGLRTGDRVIIRACGAYTSTYASVGFNGFPPLDVVVI